MEFSELNAITRTTTGNGPARRLRQEGLMPAVLYGRGTAPIALTINTRELEHALKSGSVAQSIFRLTIDGEKKTPRSVMIKELQTHPTSRDLLHADFYEIDMKRKINTQVPVAITGKSRGVEDGGTLQLVRRELDVICLPGAIPSEITIDITELGIGDSIHVEELDLPEEIEIPHDVDFTIVTVVAPTLEEEPEEEEGEEEEGVETDEAESDEDAASDEEG